MKLKLGHIVAPRNHAGTLRSGGSQYDFAIVVSLDPFQLVSYEADMYWSTTQVEENFQFVGIAPADVFNRCIQRVDPENQWRMPQGESFMHNVLGNGLTLLIAGTIPIAMDLKEFGRWYEDSEKLNNASYGWFFEYKADANMWKALRKGSDAEIESATNQARRGAVHSPKGRGLQFISSIKLQEDFDALAEERQRSVYVKHFLGRGVSDSFGGDGKITAVGYIYDRAAGKVEELAPRMERHPTDKYWNMLIQDETVELGYPEKIRHQIPAAQLQIIHKQILGYMAGKATYEVDPSDLETMVRKWFTALVDMGIVELPKGD
ncbi:hypothetical protein D3C71_78470 [compost metagenome]